MPSVYVDDRLQFITKYFVYLLVPTNKPLFFLMSIWGLIALSLCRMLRCQLNPFIIKLTKRLENVGDSRLFNYMQSLIFIKIAKSNYFEKIRPPDFLCNEFFIKMYRLLQNYTFKIWTLSKVMNISFKYNIFTGRSLFTCDRKVDIWFGLLLSFWHGFRFHR